MEVSSHALDQGRVDGVRFHSAAFTNLSRDHLDYHASMQAYGEAKARLFAGQDLEQAIINVGDSFGRELAHKLAGGAPLTAVWVGAGADAWLAERYLEAREVRSICTAISLSIEGSCGRLRSPPSCSAASTPRTCWWCSVACSRSACRSSEAAAALAACSAPPGRMEVVEAPAPGKPLAVIDYAHTPDALAKALTALREHCRGALWCVFGCGGDRDAGQAPDHGRDRRRARGPDHRHRRQSALRRSAGDHSRHHPRHQDASRAGDSGSRRGDRRRRSTRPRRATSCSSPARATRITRSTAPRAAASAIASRRSRSWGPRHEAHAARSGARLLGGTARRRGPAVRRGVDRQPHARRRRAVRRAARAELRRRGFRGRRARARRGGRDRRARRSAAAPCPTFECRMRSRRCSSSRARWRARILHSARGGGRQQRQDHDQGDDRGDSVAPRPVPGDPGQSQQSHRRAADAAAPRRPRIAAR